MNYVIMGFGSVLAIMGVILFIKGVKAKDNEAILKTPALSFSFTGPSIIFIVGCIIFMTPYVLENMKAPAQVEADKEATDKKSEQVEEARKEAAAKRIAQEKLLKEMEKQKESEIDRLIHEKEKVEKERKAKEQELAQLKLSKEERKAKEQELARLKQEAIEKVEKARLAEEIAKAEEERKKGEKEIARLQEEETKKREEAKKATTEVERRKLVERARRTEQERLTKEGEIQELRTEVVRKMEIAKEDKELAGIVSAVQMTQRAPTPVKEEHYQIDISAEFGARNAFEFKVTKPGPIKAEVHWQGDSSLALILNGPGQVGYYARKDGQSPLSLAYDVTSLSISKGSEWKMSVVNFSKKGSVTGEIVIVYPK